MNGSIRRSIGNENARFLRHFGAHEIHHVGYVGHKGEQFTFPSCRHDDHVFNAHRLLISCAIECDYKSIDLLAKGSVLSSDYSLIKAIFFNN